MIESVSKSVGHTFQWCLNDTKITSYLCHNDIINHIFGMQKAKGNILTNLSQLLNILALYSLLLSE